MIERRRDFVVCGRCSTIVRFEIYLEHWANEIFTLKSICHCANEHVPFGSGPDLEKSYELFSEKIKGRKKPKECE